MRAVVISLVVLSVAASAACHKLSGIDSKAAVQQAIEEHLKQQPNVFFQNMTVELGDVTFSGDTATRASEIPKQTSSQYGRGHSLPVAQNRR